jgi:hypothetical protein
LSRLIGFSKSFHEAVAIKIVTAKKIRKVGKKLTGNGIPSFANSIGNRSRTKLVLLWYGWACLLNRNIFIGNPSLPFIGWLLLACACIPEGEPLSIQRRADRDWQMNPIIFHGAWFLLGAGYTLSGLHKATAISWRDGSALLHVLSLPTARDNYAHALLLGLPPIVLRIMTWGSLSLEILFAPLALFPRIRPFVFFAIIGMQLGILGVISITDLTTGMLTVHLFTLDPRWFKRLP